MLKPITRIVATIALAAAILWGCEHAPPFDAGGGNGGLEPKLSVIQATIFNLSCAFSNCHGVNNTQLNLELTEGASHGNLVNVPSMQNGSVLRVNPGNPDSSYIVWKLEGRMGIGGVQMPRGRDPLSPEQIGLIRQWIADGALDN